MQLAHEVTKNDGFRLHLMTLLPLVYMSQEDFDARREVSIAPYYLLITLSPIIDLDSLA